MGDNLEEQVSQEDTQTTVEEVLTSEPVIEDNTIEPEVIEDNTLANLDLDSIPTEEPIVIPEQVIYNEHEILAISQLTEASGYILDNGVLTLISPVKEFPTPEEISTLADKIKLEATVTRLQIDLMTLCTNLYYKIKQYLSSKHVTLDQQERYTIKAEAAKAGKLEYFVDEAELLGIQPEDLMAKVLLMTKQWEDAVNLAAVKIDAARVYLGTIMTTEPEFVQFAINYFNSTIDDYSLETTVVETINKIRTEYNKTLEV